MRNLSGCVAISCHKAKIWEGVDMKVPRYLQCTVTVGIYKFPPE